MPDAPPPLLRTKLAIPPLRPELVPRPQLLARLDAEHRLTLVAAPAGTQQARSRRVFEAGLFRAMPGPLVK